MPFGDESPVVNAPSGAARGIAGPGVSTFLGLPFARPPVGPYRFSAPERVTRWSGTRDASKYGPTPQRRTLTSVTTIPEPSIPGVDILSVNVFTPAAGDRRANLPVMVWIHGGGYIAGSPASPWYDGTSFAQHGIVVVTLSYRLGFEGFGWIGDARSNRGLLDMICALEWVAENIEWFGGDPTRVTVAGQSAGGGAVLALLTSSLSRGLFSAAIAQSAVASATSAQQHEADGRAFAEMARVRPTVNGWAAIDEDRVLDLQRMSINANASPLTKPVHEFIGSAERCLSHHAVDLLFGPAVDADVLPGPSANRVWRDTTVPLLIGVTADEFVSREVQRPGPDQFNAWFSAAYGPDYPRAWQHWGRNEEIDPVGRLMAELFFRLPAADVASSRAAVGAPTWLYNFGWISPVSGLAQHCLELPFTWNVLGAQRVRDALGPNPPQQLADDMHAAWISFVTDHKPGWDPVGNDLTGCSFADGEPDVHEGILQPSDGAGLKHPFGSPGA